MVNYPSPQDYNEALQMPHLTLLDPQLAQGQVEVDSLGLPFGRTGAFAITFKVTTQGRDYAFRCFLQNRPTIHERYDGISEFLGNRPLPYFVDYRYLDSGIRVNGNEFPCLQMSWANGIPLGVYLDRHHQDQGRMTALQQQVQGLAFALEAAGMAHGDIQGGNLLIGSGGEIKLVDYDGMFVPSLESLGPLENGHPNFQHPERAGLQPFNSTVDRFSFALLHTILGALVEDPELWGSLGSDPDKFLVGEVDFASPYVSQAFDRLISLPRTGPVALALQAIASAPFGEIPTFADFLNGRNIPRGQIPASRGTATARSSFDPNETPWYMAQADSPQASSPASKAALGEYEPRFPVVDAKSFSAWINTGTRIELVVQVSRVEISRLGSEIQSVRLWLDEGNTYLSIDLWAAAVDAFERDGSRIDESWTGAWVSAVGVIEGPTGFSTAYYGLAVNNPRDLERLTPQQARWRLQAANSSNAIKIPKKSPQTSNAEAVASLTGQNTQQPVTPAGAYATSTRSQARVPAKSFILTGPGLITVIGGIIILIIAVLVIASSTGNSALIDSDGTSGSGAAAEDTDAGESSGGLSLLEAKDLCVEAVNGVPKGFIDCTSVDANYQVAGTATYSGFTCPNNQVTWSDWGGEGTLCLDSRNVGDGNGGYVLARGEDGKPWRWDICKGRIGVSVNTQDLTADDQAVAIDTLQEAIAAINDASGFNFVITDLNSDQIATDEERGVTRGSSAAVLVSFGEPQGSESWVQGVREWGSYSTVWFRSDPGWSWNYVQEAAIHVMPDALSGNLSGLLRGELAFVSGLGFFQSEVEGEVMGASPPESGYGPGDTLGLRALADKECS